MGICSHFSWADPWEWNCWVKQMVTAEELPDFKAAAPPDIAASSIQVFQHLPMLPNPYDTTVPLFPILVGVKWCLTVV